MKAFYMLEKKTRSKSLANYKTISRALTEYKDQETFTANNVSYVKVQIMLVDKIMFKRKCLQIMKLQNLLIEA